MIVYGSGIVNNILNKLPVELHIPGYQFCGPGTNLKKRLARGDSGINPLDSACKEHDMAYFQNPEDVDKRNLADKILAEKAWERVMAKDSNFGEKSAAYAITNIMKAKSKLGMGIKKRKIHFKTVLNAAKRGMKTDNGLNAIKSALSSARKYVKGKGGKSQFQSPKFIALPDVQGGALPLIPIFAGLSALGALTSGISGVAKAMNDARIARNQLEEATRHNKVMESLAIGNGLYLRPWKSGSGLRIHNEEKKNFDKFSESTLD